MPILHAIVLGIIQGLTEFLPISSSAHLIIIPWLFGWDDGGLTFDVALHAGTLVAVLLFFFRDWIQILAQGFGLNIGHDPALDKNRGLLWLLVLGTLPGAAAGFLFEKKVDEMFHGGAEGPHVTVIGAAAIAMGLLLWLADYAGRKQKDISHVSAADSLIIGISQALAIIPGVSRSGITISAGLFRNLDRASAARFSFLLSTPIIAGACAKKFWDLHKHAGGLSPDMHTAFIAGVAASAITGCLAIAFFMNYLRRRSLAVFVWYRILFGIIVIALAVFRPGGR